jgi:threonine dehydrogenase-like Zn-dependent dehydrogenase
MADCRAAVITAYNAPLEIRAVPIPELEPGGALARIEASTLCGTDVHRWHGPLNPGDIPPFITGHEPCGIIEELNGPRVDILGNPVQVGDRVVWAYPPCGQCYWCNVAMVPAACPAKPSWGHNPIDQYPYLLGSCAEYMYIMPQCQIVKVPDAISSASAAAAACAYRTIMHGFDRLGPIKSHETVVIQGCGPLGTFATAVARDHGANQILVIGAPAQRLALCERMGADATLDLDEVKDPADRRKWVLDHTAGRGADIVIQVANATAVPEGLRLLRAGGQYLNIGGGGQATLDVNAIPRQMTYHSILTAEPRHWLQAIQFLAARQKVYPIEEIISASYTLDQATQAMEDMASYRITKAVIYPHQ